MRSASHCISFLTEKQIELAQRLNIEAGEQKQMLPFSKVATLEFQKRVVEKLGPYECK